MKKDDIEKRHWEIFGAEHDLDFNEDYIDNLRDILEQDFSLCEEWSEESDCDNPSSGDSVYSLCTETWEDTTFWWARTTYGLSGPIATAREAIAELGYGPESEVWEMYAEKETPEA